MTLRRNLELKARHPNLDAAREAICLLGAGPAVTEVQRDTYFRVPHGRLKLREINGTSATLIWYERPDCTEVRASAYHLVPVADPAGMRAALTAALGLRGEVQKRRAVHLWHNVRIHLDQVAGLGNFVELEAVLNTEEDEVASPARLDQLCRALGISPGDSLASSYADLLGLA